MLLSGILVSILYLNQAFGGLDDIDLKWKARGLQAKERLDQIHAKKKKSGSDTCTTYLESGFAEHADPKSASEFKKDLDGARSYALRILSPVDPKFSETKEALAMTVMSFLFNRTGELGMAQVSMLANGWRISVFKGKHGFVLHDDKCDFYIDTVDPLRSKVIDKK